MASSPESFAGLTADLKFADKESKFERLDVAVTALLQSVCDDDHDNHNFKFDQICQNLKIFEVYFI